MPNKISEYRKKHTTNVTVPSGFEFTIRSLLPFILETSVIDPPIVAVGKGDENTLSAEEIDKDDLMFLIDKIIEFSGLKSEEGGEFPSQTQNLHVK